MSQSDRRVLVPPQSPEMIKSPLHVQEEEEEEQAIVSHTQSLYTVALSLSIATTYAVIVMELVCSSWCLVLQIRKCGLFDLGQKGNQGASQLLPLVTPR